MICSTFMTPASEAGGSGAAAFGGGGENVCAARSGLVICATICRTISQFAAWLGLTAIKCPRIGRPSSERSPTMSSILCRTNSSGYRIGSVVSTASSRMTTAFSRLPPLMRLLLDEKLDFFVETKRPRVRQFLFPRFGRDFRAVKLCEPALLVRTRAGDFEAVVGKQRHHRFARPPVQSARSACKIRASPPAARVRRPG